MDNLFRVNSLEHKEEKKKGKLIQTKDNMINSLQEVEFFLRQGKKALKGVKLYNILKK